MKMRCYLLLILLAVIFQGEMQAQTQPFKIPVTTPVSGYLVMSGDLEGISSGGSGTRLFLLDTATGQTQIPIDNAIVVSSPVFDSSGEKIAFFKGQVGIQIYDI